MKKTKKEVVVKKTAIKKSIFNKNKRKRNVTKNSSNGMNISHNGLMSLISTYLDKAEYFTKPNRELARIIKSEHPELTQNIEAIRTNIRILKGCCGKTNIAYNYAGGKYYVDKNDYNKSVHFPISDSKERTPFYLPLGVKIGCMFDIHVPFHDNRAVDACINHLLKSNVKVVLLQEVFDFYFQSKFDKDIRKPAFVDQMEKYIDFMYELKDAFPKGTKFYYQESNHDER